MFHNISKNLPLNKKMLTFASTNSFNLFYLRYCTYWKFIGAELRDKFRFLFTPCEKRDQAPGHSVTK